MNPTQSVTFHHLDAIDQYGVLVDGRTHSYVFYWYFVAALWDHCETIYSERTSELPAEYVDIRQLVTDIGPLVVIVEDANSPVELDRSN